MHLTRVADVEVGVVSGVLGQVGDLAGQVTGAVERSGLEHRLDAAQQVSPVGEVRLGIESGGRETFGHASHPKRGSRQGPDPG